jgi:hypothetical protein
MKYEEGAGKSNSGIFLTSDFQLPTTFLTFAILSSAYSGAGMVTRLRKLELVRFSRTKFQTPV